jgi:hypothetical protein
MAARAWARTSYSTSLPQRILGMSVKETTAEELFGDAFALNAALGASFLVVNEVKDLVNFSLAKGLSRSEWHEVNRKYGGKGQQRGSWRSRSI